MNDSIITTDFNVQMQRLSDSLSTRFRTLGGNVKIVVKRQAGLLARTLINISPPANKEKSAKRIESRVYHAFEQMSDQSLATGDPRKAGQGGVVWTGSHKFALYGIGRNVDFREASVETLEQLFLGRKTGNAKRAKFLRGHGQQDVYINQQITTKKSTVKKLVAKMQKRLGKLKAAWMVSWEACGHPGKPIPQWIANHRPGARGDVVINLEAPGSPSITIVNSASGVSAMKKFGLLASALRIRADAVVKDIQFAIAHPKEWSEREARSEAAAE